MSSRPLELPPRMQRLYSLLDGKGDVDILEVYMNAVDPDPRPLREMQQRLGSNITRLNRRLRNHGQVVKPGRLKGTYCLTTL